MITILFFHHIYVRFGLRSETTSSSSDIFEASAVIDHIVARASSIIKLNVVLFLLYVDLKLAENETTMFSIFLLYTTFWLKSKVRTQYGAHLNATISRPTVFTVLTVLSVTTIIPFPSVVHTEASQLNGPCVETIIRQISKNVDHINLFANINLVYIHLISFKSLLTSVLNKINLP